MCRNLGIQLEVWKQTYHIKLWKMYSLRISKLKPLITGRYSEGTFVTPIFWVEQSFFPKNFMKKLFLGLKMHFFNFWFWFTRVGVIILFFGQSFYNLTWWFLGIFEAKNLVSIYNIKVWQVRKCIGTVPPFLKIWKHFSEFFKVHIMGLMNWIMRMHVCARMVL